ncbi:MAG: hypothetical protein RSA27_09125, partial [Oscillospiraceae bacterium]
TPASTKIEDVKNQEEYTRLMEERLEATLSKIAGAGMVSVMLIVDSDGEKVFATDTKTKTNKQAKSETAESSNTEEEENIVIAGQGASGQPVIVEEKRPYPSGILVVAEGAKDETVRYEIYEAVKALYDLSPHRIKVTY